MEIKKLKLFYSANKISVFFEKNNYAFAFFIHDDKHLEMGITLNSVINLYDAIPIRCYNIDSSIKNIISILNKIEYELDRFNDDELWKLFANGIRFQSMIDKIVKNENWIV